MLRNKLRSDRRRLARAYYAEGVSSDLQSQPLMEKTQLKKEVDILRQENKKLLEDWVHLKPHLGDLKVLSMDQEEKTSCLQNHQRPLGHSYVQHHLFL